MGSGHLETAGPPPARPPAVRHFRERHALRACFPPPAPGPRGGPALAGYRCIGVKGGGEVLVF